MLDFPRPLPVHIAFSGELGDREGKKAVMEKWLEEIIEKPSDGLIVFSLGTVSNTTNMPAQMIVSQRPFFENSFENPNFSRTRSSVHSEN